MRQTSFLLLHLAQDSGHSRDTRHRVESQVSWPRSELPSLTCNGCSRQELWVASGIHLGPGWRKRKPRGFSA